MMMLKEAAVADKEYAMILKARIKNISKSEIKELPHDNPCRAMINVWDKMNR